MICSEEHNCTNDNEKNAFGLILKRRVSNLTVVRVFFLFLR